MTINNPFNLYDLYNELNEGNCDPDVDTSGYWSFLATNPAFGSATLCTSADGVTYSLNTYQVPPSPNSVIINVNTHNPWVDLSGASCGCGAFTGYSVINFSYTIPAQNGCSQQVRTLTINKVTNSVSLSRSNEACMYELWAKNPNNGTDTAPNIEILSNYITPSWFANIQVQRRSLENCGATGFVYSDAFTSGTSIASYTTNGSVVGPTVTHYIETTEDIIAGGFLMELKVAGFGTVHLNSVVRGVGMPIATFRSNVRAAINAALAGTTKYRVSVVQGTGANRIRIQFLCANGGPWYGLDKNDALLSWCSDGNCGTPPTPSGSATTITQVVAGSFAQFFSPYTTPCGSVPSMWVDMCPNLTELGIFNLANCNWNTLSLTNVSGRRYYVYDTGTPITEPSFRQNICQTTTVTISSSGCPGPLSPADLSWQIAGPTNPKVFDPLEQDTAISDCGGCIAQKPFCFPEARDAGHAVQNGRNCSKTTSDTYELSIGSSVSKCGGGAVTMNDLTVHDVPAAFSSCTTNPATQRITSTLPANSLPRTYYVAYRWRGPDNEWSNYALKRYNYLKNDCCT